MASGSFMTFIDADDLWKPQFVWPETTNFPTFDAYYFHKDGAAYPLQMTIATETGADSLLHHLNSNGAYQTKKYLEAADNHTKRRKLSGERFKAVFVVPASMAGAKKQRFKGSVTSGKKTVLDKDKAAQLLDKTFEQWLFPISD